AFSLSFEANHLRADREINLLPDDRHNGARRSMPFVDQAVRGICRCRFFVPALVLPTKVRRAVEAAIAVTFAEKVRDGAGLPIERTEEALVIADQEFR